MRITFLGTSHGVSSKDRYCSCNMIEVNGAIYFVDMGAPAMEILITRGVPASRTRAFFNTHFHGDHIHGLINFSGLCGWKFKETHIQFYLAEENALKYFPKMRPPKGMLPPEEENRLSFLLVQPGLFYEDENIRMTALPNGHLKSKGRPSYSFLLEAEGKRVIFTGDLSNHLAEQDFPQPEEEIDLLISEMAHFSIEEARPYLETCKTKRALFTHVFPEEKIPCIDALNGQFLYPVGTVKDNDFIDL